MKGHYLNAILFRKISFLILLFLQVQPYAQSTFGVHGGLVRSNLSFLNLNESGWKFKNDYLIGIHSKKKLSKYFTYNTMLQYSRKGLSQSEYNESMPYLEFLNSISFYTNKYYSLDAGFGVSYLLPDHEDLIIDTKVDAGFTLGFTVPVKRTTFSFQYYHGFINTERNSEVFLQENIKSYIHNFQFSVGYNLFQKSNDEKQLEILDDIEPAQKKKNEIGIRTSDLGSFDAFYKRENTENLYQRYRVGAGRVNIGFFNEENDKTKSISLSAAAGMEKRRKLEEWIYFIHGIETLLGYDFSYLNDTNETSTFTAGLGLPIGLFIKVNNKFHFGIEAIPSATINFQSYNGGIDYPIRLNFTGNNDVSLFGMYIF